MFNKGPLRLEVNRVERVYPGGWLVDRFLGKTKAAEGYSPENWIGSTVRARNLGHQQTGQEGLSFGCSLNGERFLLKDLIEQDPAGLLGEAHASRYGANPGVLVKILDASLRLPIQVHPSKSLAMRYFNSPFGKTEAWLILEISEIHGEPPYILLGFKEGVSPGQFGEAVSRNDSRALEKCLHRVEVEPGQVYLIESGLPHAIGPGSLILEIQEPTDLTISAEKTVGENRIPDERAYLGLTLEQSLTCYNFEPLERAKLLQRYQLRPSLVEKRPGQGCEEALITYRNTSCFALHSLHVDSSWEAEGRDTFHLVLVLGGKGTLTSQGTATPVQRGDSFFIPARVPYLIENSAEEPVQLVTCWPPADRL